MKENKIYICIHICLYIYEKSYRIGQCQRILLIFSLRSKRIPHSFNNTQGPTHEGNRWSSEVESVNRQ